MTVNGAGSETARPRLLRERVVGMSCHARLGVAGHRAGRVPGVVAASTALWHQLGPGYEAFDAAYVKLSPGVTLNSFSRRAQALSRRFPATQGQVYLTDERTQAATVERADPAGSGRVRRFHARARGDRPA